MSLKLLKFLALKGSKIIYISFVLCLPEFCTGAQDPLFMPHIIHYNGFLSEVSFRDNKDWYFFYVYSKKYHRKLRFKFKNGMIKLDRRYKIVFWGSSIPTQVAHLYGNKSYFDWMDCLPQFDEDNDQKRRNFFGRTYEMNTKRMCINAFNYKEYADFKEKHFLPNLINWIIFVKTIYPEMVVNDIDFLLATNFFEVGN